ncbi:zinc ABC transporter substrate-binding protein [Magnetospirillum sp. 64-120]|uniref:zinc ABC transporter substrate-binding protein n=1 Tax=Magnetospirillum sp. 64-120 TaxID=1895778 RepID=UPI0009260598|nr:zinc ABC transporter substrate-binding protein [Magnetospirillum sp. 64-120]OJX74325.1 MAG: zinc ABC transporter substrate-binding protein [Magnetospirillum sp. 64-120]
MWKPLAFIAPLLALSLPAHAEVPKVVASIQPLHSLAAMVMDGLGTPTLLVSGSASEHGYTLKPSDMRAIEAAQVAVIVDTGYETFLAKPLKARGDKIATIAMADLPGLAVYEPREGGVWEAHDHKKHEHDAHGHDHHDELDGHVWLDPRNAQLLLTALSEQLSELDPANAAAYHRNADAARAKLAALDGALKDKLAPLAGKPFVVFHDAYQYFEARYGLNGVGSITVDPDRSPSAKRMAALKDKLVKAKAACVFREPQFPAGVVDSLAKSANTRVGLLDPQGATLPPGPGLYPALLENMADSLTKCLGTP